MTGTIPSQTGPTVSVAASFASDGLRQVVQFWMDQAALGDGVMWAPYGQVLPCLLDVTGAWRAASGPKVIFLRDNDALFGESSFLAGLRAMVAERPVAVVIAPVSGGHRVGANIPVELSDIPRLTIIDGAAAFKDYGVQEPFDLTMAASADVPFSEDGHAALVSAAWRWVTRATTQPVKMIAVDADNTLWNGVIGEVGAAGVEVTPAHRALHQRLRNAAEAGRVLVMLTKNNPDDIAKAWPGVLGESLPRELFLSVEAGWGAKSAAMAACLERFEVDPASAVFLDDNPLECADIRAAFPTLRVVNVPETGVGGSFVRHLWALDAAAETQADLSRLESYRTAAARRDAEAEAPNLQAFFDSLELDVSIRPIGPSDVERVTQLSVRTTQFNANPHELTPADLRDPRVTTKVVQVRDRFGDYGIVGVLRYENIDGGISIDTFLMSCRALGRGVEHQMVRHLAEQAGTKGVSFRVTATERNVPMRQFLQKISGTTEAADQMRIPTGTLGQVEFTPGEAPATIVRGQSPAAVPTGFDEKAATRWTTAEAIVEESAPAVRARPSEMGTFVAPREGLETMLSTQWEQLLRVDRIGRHDLLPELGAGSLHLVRAHARLVRQLKRSFDLSLMFRGQTVAELAELLGVPNSSVADPVKTGAARRAAAADVAARRRQTRGGRA